MFDNQPRKYGSLTYNHRSTIIKQRIFKSIEISIGGILMVLTLIVYWHDARSLELCNYEESEGELNRSGLYFKTLLILFAIAHGIDFTAFTYDLFNIKNAIFNLSQPRSITIIRSILKFNNLFEAALMIAAQIIYFKPSSSQCKQTLREEGAYTYIWILFEIILFYVYALFIATLCFIIAYRNNRKFEDLNSEFSLAQLKT